MNCIIIDDEPIARQGMSKLVEEMTELLLVGKFSNTADALSYMKLNEVDLIFLDVEMPGMNGLDFARELPQKTLVIFTTAYAQYALEGFEVDAIDYLVKPIRKERFIKAVDKALQFNRFLSESYEKNHFDHYKDQHLFIRADRKLHKIELADILYIEGMKDYVVINLREQKLITAMNVKTVLSKLPPEVFIRISKSYIVNINAVTSLANHAVYIKEIELPLGMTYREDFFSRYKKKIRQL